MYSSGLWVLRIPGQQWWLEVVVSAKAWLLQRSAVLTEVYVHVKQLSAVHAQTLKSPLITYASRVQCQWCERIV